MHSAGDALGVGRHYFRNFWYSALPGEDFRWQYRAGRLFFLQ